jgi:MATE family multidrug resistance protein
MQKNNIYGQSYKDLLKLAVPSMLTWMSTTLMMFVDRLFLSNYSLEALGAAVNAGTIAWGIVFGFQIFAEMSQVVIAQYRGAGKEDKLSYPVWQMLWIVAFSGIFFIPMAVFGSKAFFVAGSLQSEYFMWFILFGPAFGLIGAGSAYFIGRGENHIITITAVVGNIMNLVLDYFMIFGVEGLFAPMGVKGAAIATGIGISVQGALLLILFLRRTNYKVLPFDFEELKPCLRVGISPSISRSVEIIGWGMFFSIMAKAGDVHLIVTSVCHSLLPLFACMGIGLQKAVSTITGNWIGAGKMDQIPKLVQKASIVLSLYMAAVALLLYLFPDLLIQLFQNKKLDVELHELLRTGFMLSVAYLFFGGIRSIVTGVLSAAGDAWFIMILGILSIWLFLLAPVYYFVILNSKSVTFAQSLLLSYGAIGSLIYLTRYRYGKWAENASLIKE